jgi:hypothetical protein
MKKCICTVLLLVLTASLLFGDEVDTMRRAPGRPKMETWFVYLDYTLDVFQDIKVDSLDVKDSTFPVPDAPFLITHDEEIIYRSHALTIGCYHIFRDTEGGCLMSWYVGGGPVGVNIDLFESGTIGTDGLKGEGGIQGDIMRFGQMRDHGLAFDATASVIWATGDHGDAVKEDHELWVYGLEASFYYTHDVFLFDTSYANAFIGIQAAYSLIDLTEDLEAATGSGTGEYSLMNKGVNMVYILLGSQMSWKSSRTKADLRARVSIDGSYSIALSILQSF